MPKLRAPRRLMLAIACSGALATVAAGLGYRESLSLQTTVLARAGERYAAHGLQNDLAQLESEARAHLLYRQIDYVERFHRAAARIEAPSTRRILALIDAETEGPSLVEILARALEERRRALRMVAEGRAEQVIAVGARGEPRQTVDAVQEAITEFIDRRRAQVTELVARLDVVQRMVLLLVACTSLLSGLGLWLAWVQIRRRSHEAEATRNTLSARSDEIGALLRMNEMLQACQTRDDVETVVRHSATRVLRGTAGSLYVFSNSRDRLDRAATWPESSPATGATHFSPQHCWAMKRGRPHSCGGDSPGCEAAACGERSLCLPMAARGEMYGVLRFAEAPMLAEGQGHQRQLADALADAVSMALANLSLREKLRGEALRDAMTGLYNRRFLEEVAPAFLRQSERRISPVCVAMLDVDHFKKVNDKHGHVVGDTLLRSLATTLTTALRSSDVICRYGGEEFLLLLPDCDLGAALERMEEVRRHILFMHETSPIDLPGITASIGLAQVEAGALSLDKSIRQADEALYAAKQTGRNRVLTAPMAANAVLLEGATEAPGHPDE